LRLTVEDVLRITGLLLGEEALEITNPDRVVIVDALAVKLAGVGADVAEDTGEREPLPDQVERLAIASEARELHVAPGIDVERTAALTVGRAFPATALEDAIGELGQPIGLWLRERGGPRNARRKGWGDLAHEPDPERSGVSGMAADAVTAKRLVTAP
jgi:hypothetical protein